MSGIVARTKKSAISVFSYQFFTSWTLSSTVLARPMAALAAMKTTPTVRVVRERWMRSWRLAMLPSTRIRGGAGRRRRG